MSDWAHAVVDEIIADILARRGLRVAFWQLGREMQEEIRTEWARIIRCAAPSFEP